MSSLSTVWGSLAAAGFAKYGIPFIDNNNEPNIDLNNLIWNFDQGRFYVGHSGDVHGTSKINFVGAAETYVANAALGTVASKSTPSYIVSSSRGNGGVPTASTDQDFLGKFAAWGYTVVTPQFEEFTAIRSYAAGATSGNLGGEIRFAVKGDGTTLQEQWKFNTVGNFLPMSDNSKSIGSSSVGIAALYASKTTAGATGDITINNVAGKVRFAAATTSLTLTNSYISPTSVIVCTLNSNDTTAKSCCAVPGVGSAVLILNAAATAETVVSFWVIP